MNKPIKLIFAAILALTIFQAPATAETVLKFASFVPAKYVLHKPVFMKLANDLAKATNGNNRLINPAKADDLRSLPTVTISSVMSVSTRPPPSNNV